MRSTVLHLVFGVIIAGGVVTVLAKKDLIKFNWPKIEELLTPNKDVVKAIPVGPDGKPIEQLPSAQ